MPADIFENFRNKYIEIYQLDPAQFLSAPWLPWQACLKLELLTDNNMLIMIEKGIRSGLFHTVHKYSTGNNKYTKIMIKTMNDHTSCT